jgi:radical SAM protein with 4Fe4S-binding SPASM domain
MKINKNQIILTDKFNALRFFLNRGKGHLLRYLVNRVRWSWYPRLGYVSKFPDHIDIETTNRCNMNCAMCFRPIMFKGGIKPGFMDFKLYKKIIDQAGAHHAYSIRLSWRGEPLVHPKIVDMIKYAKQKGIKEVSFLTNALNLKGKLAEDIVKSGIDWITVSFDGLGATYEKIRRPAKFDEAIQRLKDFQAIKKRLNTTKPVLKVQSIWPAIEKDPQKFYNTFKDIADNISSNPYKAFYESDKIDHDPNFICPQPWHRFVITWDGKVTQCICSYMEDGIVGDVNKQSIAEIWRGEAFNKVRKLQRQRNRLVMSCCRNCFDGAKKKKVKVKVGGRASRQYTYDRDRIKTKNQEIKEIISGE